MSTAPSHTSSTSSTRRRHGERRRKVRLLSLLRFFPDHLRTWGTGVWTRALGEPRSTRPPRSQPHPSPRSPSTRQFPPSHPPRTPLPSLRQRRRTSSPQRWRRTARRKLLPPSLLPLHLSPHRHPHLHPRRRRSSRSCSKRCSPRARRAHPPPLHHPRHLLPRPPLQLTPSRSPWRSTRPRSPRRRSSPRRPPSPLRPRPSPQRSRPRSWEGACPARATSPHLPPSPGASPPRRSRHSGRARTTGSSLQGRGRRSLVGAGRGRRLSGRRGGRRGGEGPSKVRSFTVGEQEARLAKLARKATASQPGSAKSSRPGTPAGGGGGAAAKKGVPAVGGKGPLPPAVSALRSDMEAMGLVQGQSARAQEQQEKEERRKRAKQEEEEEQAPAAVSVAKEKILEEVRAKEKDQKPVLSLVVVGHVDAGKSTLMGRVLHELGATSDKEIFNYQRQSEKIGKGSFAYAWTFDALEEERERGVTIDVAIDSFETPRRRFTLIDAPGHRDFIPNMISGAAQADAAVLVVDGSSGGFEKGFEGGGQTREHAVLVRSLGVQQLVVAVNKLDTVGWSEKRFEAIRDALQPFLTQTGFTPNKVSYVPVGAMSGENLTQRTNETLKAWYEGRSLVDELDALDVPPRALDAPLRIPVSNVFKGQSATASGLAVSGRIESGIVQVGEKLAALPGDEAGVVRALEVEGELVLYALAGSNVTVFLAGIEANQLSVGSVLCPPSQPVPVVSAFTAQIIVFEPAYPITAGYAVELFHHSQDIPATIVALDALLDKTTGAVSRANPRMLTKGVSARIRVQLRTAPGAGRTGGIPLEPFAANKGMGRVLFRRNGETVAAGIVLEVLQ